MGLLGDATGEGDQDRLMTSHAPEGGSITNDWEGTERGTEPIPRSLRRICLRSFFLHVALGIPSSASRSSPLFSISSANSDPVTLLSLKILPTLGGS